MHALEYALRLILIALIMVVFKMLLEYKISLSIPMISVNQ